MSTIAETLQVALAHHQAGRRQLAEQLYRQVLAADPGHAGALHLLGLLVLQSGRPALAVDYISAAIRLSGNQAVFHANLGEALRALGRWDDARRSYEQAIAIEPNLAAAHNNLGTILQVQGQLAASIGSYRRALAIQPAYADAHNNLGTALQAAGDAGAAIECFRQAISLEPRAPRAHYNLGVALATRGELAAACGEFEQAMLAAPNYAEAHHGLGLALQRLGEYARAETAYARALQLRPQWPEAASSLGSLLQAQGQLDRAAALYEQALATNPHFADAHYNLGTVLKERNRYEEAMDRYRQAIACKPNFPEAHYNLGTLLQKAERLDEAAAAYQEAVRLRPDYALAHNNLGNVYRAQERIGEALACYERALQLEPSSSSVESNLGSLWHQEGQIERAMACYDRAMQVNPDSAEVLNNLGTALEELGREEEALACFDRSAKLAPEVGEARYNRALLHLSRRRFAAGWPDFGAWLECKKYISRDFAVPLWNGEAMPQGTLVVYAEQGFGDTLQLVRYLPQVRRLVKSVVLEVQPPLVPLLRASGFGEVIGGGDPLPPHDAHLPLTQLPAVFAATEETMAVGVPYLAAEPALLDKWRARLADLPGFKIGIAWQGNPKYSGDARRSIPLVEYAPLAAVPGVRLFSLQKGHGVEQLAAVSGQMRIEDLAPELDGTSGAFMDTAAVMQSLDLMITSDTAIAHLAGALGVPTWVALSNHPDWRWFRELDRSPWYPSMRLFRQQRQGDWTELFARMAEELRRVVEQPR
jgi:tetratricopeptide (TPR) repeat protein